MVQYLEGHMFQEVRCPIVFIGFKSAASIYPQTHLYNSKSNNSINFYGAYTCLAQHHSQVLQTVSIDKRRSKKFTAASC